MKHFIKSLVLGLALLVPVSAFAENSYVNATAVYDINERKIVKFAFANVAAAQTDSALVAAVASKRIKVLYYSAGAAGTATDFQFNTKPGGAGSAVHATLRAAASTWQSAYCPVGCFQTAAGEGLAVTTGAGATVGISIAYIEAEP